jgi:nucleoid-associated protein YgaU
MSDTGGFKRAFLQPRQPSSSGGKVGAKSARIDFEFNPKEFVLKREATWKTKDDKKASMPEFTGSKPANVTLEMFLDASTGGDVTEKVKRLFELVDPHPATKRDKPVPPFVTFGWGKQVYLRRAIVKSVDVKYTRFRSTGEPIRAIATVALEELRPPASGQNPTSYGEARSAQTFTQGDTLASIAYREYGSPKLWRLIAATNGIDDPFRVAIGQRLMIPAPTSPSNGTRGAT